ncbi:AraC family ligand binding domain-containing protein [Anaerotignum sp. MB30-C6]|uniref:AraC family ligand binding domain-containing protein n=1 Tax=Anaerotignum sp. MB30-C6 TaxID=3070814 RepID=UPI002FE6CF2C
MALLKWPAFFSLQKKEYTLDPGNLLLFNPHDNHACEQINGKILDYRCINIQPEISSL